MAIPPRSPFNVVSRLRREAGNSVFDGTGEDVAVVGEAGGEGGTVVEGVFFVAALLGESVLGVHEVGAGPEFADIWGGGGGRWGE